MIDIHCHILPGIDDGSPDLESSLAMARIAANDGIHTIIATPHISDISSSKQSLLDAVTVLNSELKQHNIPLTVLCGAEVQAHIALIVADRFCLADSSFLLLEFPHSYLPGDAAEVIAVLMSRSITPIIAHPERNRDAGREPWKLTPLIEIGAKIQITAESLTGKMGITAKNCAEYLLQNKQVHYLATDSHAPEFRKPVLSQAVSLAAKTVGEDQARKMAMAPGIFPSYPG